MLSQVEVPVAQYSLDMTVIDPDGKVVKLGRVFWHRNPIIMWLIGGYERRKLERNTRAWNKKHPLPK